MLEKIPVLDADAFILDLEDSVSFENKQSARKNISSILPLLKKNKKTIFVRINEARSMEARKDIKETYCPILKGYFIPKFESIESIKELVAFLEKLEGRYNTKKTGLMLMIESPRGIQELRKLSISADKDVIERLSGIALGSEDYLESIAISGNISKEALDPVRDELILFAHARNILAIDTIFPDFHDDEGLKIELKKIISRGFTSKLAIHPSQVNIINKVFYPNKEDIKKMNLILSNEEKIKSKGAVSISGVMHDAAHLKWAKKLSQYIEDLKEK